MKKIKKFKSAREITVTIVKADKDTFKKSKGDVEIEIVPRKKFFEKPILPETGSRFKLGSARQLALDLVIKFAQAGKTIDEIRTELAFCKKEDGYKYNLDGGYAFFVISCHPEFFKLYKNGVVEVTQLPVPDVDAYRKSKQFINRIKQNVCLNRSKRRLQAVTI